MPFCKMMAHTIVLIHRQTGQKYFENIFRNGVMMSVGEALRVTAADSVGMRIVVKAGSASLKGYQYINTSALQYLLTLLLQHKIEQIQLLFVMT